jgi:hypothetical protein
VSWSALVAVAVAASPFLEKFPKTVLPLTLDKEHHTLGAAIDAEEARARLGTLWERWKPSSEDVKVELHAGATVPWPGATWLLLYKNDELPMGTSETAWLVALGEGGAVLEAKAVAEWSNSEAGEVREKVTLAADGTFTVERAVKPALQDLEEEMAVIATSKGRAAKGHVTVEPFVFASNEGRFIDEKSKEQLSLMKSGKVWYQANGDKPPQELVVDGDPKAPQLSVTFKKGKKPYRLSFDEVRGKLTCKNPDGSVQTFVRAWYAR